MRGSTEGESSQSFPSNFLKYKRASSIYGEVSSSAAFDRKIGVLEKSVVNAHSDNNHNQDENDGVEPVSKY